MSDNPITLYLHIGTSKTGTSSIQNFMAGNLRILWRSCSCLYPNMKGRHFLNGNFINHMSLFNSCDEKTILLKIRQAVSFSKKNGKKKIVLSAESLFESGEGLELAKKILSIPDVSLKVIVYLRRQDTWLESAWKQWGYKISDNRDIYDYIQKRDCNWYTRLKIWENAVGKERLIVRCYEKEQLPEGLIADFLSLIGIDYHSHAWIEQADLFKGFQRDVMEIIFLNKDFCDGVSDNRLQNFFERNLEETFQKESFKSYSFLSPTDRIQILKRYEDSNRSIAIEFLKREDGMLFTEPWPSETDPWEPYRGLTIESVVPVFMYMLYSMYEKPITKGKHVQKKTGRQNEVRNKPDNLIKKVKAGLSRFKQRLDQFRIKRSGEIL